MRLEIYTYKHEWKTAPDPSLDSENTLIILFGTSKDDLLSKPLADIARAFPLAVIIGASTAGEIVQDELDEDSLVVAIMEFSTTKIKSITEQLTSTDESYTDGLLIANRLIDDDLKAMFVLSDGLNVNGSQLTKGIASVLPAGVVVTGGLAGDDDRFEKTWVIVDGKAVSGHVTAVGFYGDDIHVAHGSKGGWDRLGIERIVTRSKDNILYTLDGQPALEIYKRYLGEKAEGLPATGLLFPLELKAASESSESKVRTILAIDEEEQSITFAGDVPEGSFATLMKANYDRLIDGASEAAEMIDMDAHQDEPLLSIAISCVGRKLVLKQRVEEELEVTLDVLPQQTRQIGFYSYGEISPLASGTCDLHNQTMTLTVIWESDAPTA